MIKKAQSTQLPLIMNLIRVVTKDLQAQGINQWHEGYPKVDDVLQNIEKGELYVLEQSASIIGMVTLNEAQDPEYADIDWLNKEGKTLVIHRLAVHPAWQGKGIGQQMMDFTEQLATQQQYVSIRFDTYSKNPQSLRFYERRGYQRLGQIQLPLELCDEKCYCYEKLM